MDVSIIFFILNLPVVLEGEPSKAFCRCNVEGSSLSRSETVRLNGDVVSWSLVNPRNEPWRASMLVVAWGRCTANGLSTDRTGTGSGQGENWLL